MRVYGSMPLVGCRETGPGTPAVKRIVRNFNGPNPSNCGVKVIHPDNVVLEMRRLGTFERKSAKEIAQHMSENGYPITWTRVQSILNHVTRVRLEPADTEPYWPK